MWKQRAQYTRATSSPAKDHTFPLSLAFNTSVSTFTLSMMDRCVIPLNSFFAILNPQVLPDPFLIPTGAMLGSDCYLIGIRRRMGRDSARRCLGIASLWSQHRLNRRTAFPDVFLWERVTGSIQPASLPMRYQLLMGEALQVIEC